MRRYILQHTLLLLELEVILTVNVGETPLAGDDDLLATGELVTGTTESLLDDGGVLVLGTDRKDDLANVDTGDGTVRLAPGTTHTSLESRERVAVRRELYKRKTPRERNVPIGSGTRQHLVDTEDVEGVDTDPHVEGILSRGLGDILVGANTSCFEGFG